MSSSEGTRFTEYTTTDHQAPLWIATSITLTYAGFILLVRISVKYELLGLDDGFLGIAHLVGIAQWASMFAALNHGVGKLNPETDARGTSDKLVFASRLLTLLIVGFTKCSVILFLRQLFAGTNVKGRLTCNIFLVVTVIWTFISVLAVGVDCHPSGALLSESQAQCPGDLARWKVVTAVDVLIEVVLIVVPAWLFYPVQIRRAQKFIIFGSFVPRIVVPALFIAYLESYTHFRNHGGSSLTAVESLVWQQVLCGYSLITATTPCLKGFLGRFRTEDLARITDTGSYRTGSYNHSISSQRNPQSFAMQSLERTASGKRPRPPDDDFVPPTVPSAPGLHTATAYAGTDGDNGDGSVKSFGSQQMIIHRKVEYGVTTS